MRRGVPSYYYEMLEDIDMHSVRTTVTAAGLTCDLVDGASGVHKQLHGTGQDTVEGPLTWIPIADIVIAVAAVAEHAASNDTCAAERAFARGQNVVRGRLGAHASGSNGDGCAAPDGQHDWANVPLPRARETRQEVRPDPPRLGGRQDPTGLRIQWVPRVADLAGGMDGYRPGDCGVEAGTHH